MNRSTRTLNWISRIGAPFVLIVIACLQIYLAQTQDLSRWKGGGFGMFSTLDSPSARFLRIYIITEAGEFPVVVPSHLVELKDRVRAVPSESSVRTLSAELARSRWIRNDGESQIAEDSASSEVSNSASSSKDPPFYRALGRNEVLQATLVEVQAIRVELWRYRAVPTENQLVATRLLVQTTPANPEALVE